MTHMKARVISRSDQAVLMDEAAVSARSGRMAPGIFEWMGGKPAARVENKQEAVRNGEGPGGRKSRRRSREQRRYRQEQNKG